MSESKLISPLLDGFTIGNAISDHDGVRCCPAIKENTDKKYIVKIISIPASQVQLDALLLAGAYRDPADAMDYFRQIGEDILQEAELLKKLSKLDGFLPYEGWQMEPITRHRLGYEIYLVGSYKRSLVTHLKRHPVTHLEALNLSLDLCSALTVCRQAGAIYVDLKPSNVFVSEKKEYRIGDLGFLRLDELNYAVLPAKYYSPYTPPELYDPMVSLNLTVDTYAVGMILYQLYNDGQLPFKGLRNVETDIPSPVNADYEMSEIIMKAIHADPTQRWDDPADLGKALAAYMQRNTVNDVPITPHIPLDVKPEDIVVLPKKKKKEIPVEEHQIEADEMIVAEKTISAETAAPIEKSADVELPAEENLSELCEQETEISSENTEIPIEAEGQPLQEEGKPKDPVMEEPPAPEPVSECLAEESEFVEVDSTPEHMQPQEMSDELSRIISRADDLISHEIPEELIMEDPEDAPDPFAFVVEDSDEIDDSDIPVDPVMDDQEESVQDTVKQKKNREKKFEDPKYKRRKKRLISTILSMILLCLLGVGGFWYYQNMYLQTIHDITIEAGRDELIVSVDTDADESLLRIICSDNYGNSLTHDLTNGTAVFKDLLPNTMYKIQLEIDGFHGLVGKTSDVFTTEANTKIKSFTSVAGAEDGSVMLNFTVDGEEPDSWTVFYSAEGEDELRKTFTGHSVTINGLSVGKTYTFTLDTSDNLTLNGSTTLQVIATRLILADKLTVSSKNGSDITVNWDVPGDAVIESWDVRCYNNSGYDEQVFVTDTEAAFQGLDPAFSYTIEVTAAGMTQPARTSITKKPILIQDIKVENKTHEDMNVSWEFTGTQPKDGWLLIYSIDGGEKNVVKAAKNTAQITPRIPGARYDIQIQATDGTTIFNHGTLYSVPVADPFDKHALTADGLSVDLVKTPEDEKWYYENLGSEAITETFKTGDKISIVLRSKDSFYLPGTSVDILYVIRDTFGNVLTNFVSEESVSWKSIWNGGEVKNGELNLPKVPTNPGNYVLNLYFDGMSVAECGFTIQ